MQGFAEKSVHSLLCFFTRLSDMLCCPRRQNDIPYLDALDDSQSGGVDDDIGHRRHEDLLLQCHLRGRGGQSLPPPRFREDLHQWQQSLVDCLEQHGIKGKKMSKTKKVALGLSRYLADEEAVVIVVSLVDGEHADGPIVVTVDLHRHKPTEKGKLQHTKQIAKENFFVLILLVAK